MRFRQNARSSNAPPAAKPTSFAGFRRTPKRILHEAVRKTEIPSGSDSEASLNSVLRMLSPTNMCTTSSLAKLKAVSAFRGLGLTKVKNSQATARLATLQGVLKTLGTANKKFARHRKKSFRLTNEDFAMDRKGRVQRGFKRVQKAGLAAARRNIGVSAPLQASLERARKRQEFLDSLPPQQSAVATALTSARAISSKLQTSARDAALKKARAPRRPRQDSIDLVDDDFDDYRRGKAKKGFKMLKKAFGKTAMFKFGK